MEEERRRAEEKLQRRMERMKAKEKQQQGSGGVDQTDSAKQPGIITWGCCLFDYSNTKVNMNGTRSGV